MLKAKLVLPLAIMMGLAVLLACGTTQLETPGGSAPYATTLTQAKAAAAERGQNALVEFYTDW